jgi:hypothetical protein
MADVTTALSKWQQNTTKGADAYKASVGAVTVAPTQLAARAADSYIAGVQAAVQSGRWQDGLNAVSLQDWQQACINKGAGRIASGVKEAVPKMQAFLTQLIPYTERLKAQIRAMPKTNDAEADARLMAAVQGMRQFRFRKGRGA